MLNRSRSATWRLALLAGMIALAVQAFAPAAIAQEALQYLAKFVADQSFNAITIDGDTSTNDSFVVVATGRAAHPAITRRSRNVRGRPTWDRLRPTVCQPLPPGRHNDHRRGRIAARRSGSGGHVRFSVKTGAPLLAMALALTACGTSGGSVSAIFATPMLDDFCITCETVNAPCGCASCIVRRPTLNVPGAVWMIVSGVKRPASSARGLRCGPR